jgi:hypothetical protein
MRIYVATFDDSSGNFVGHTATRLTVSKLQIKKRNTWANAVSIEITKAQYNQIADGWTASKSGGVVTVAEPAGWLENKTNEAWRKIRKQRNQLLKDSDYIMFPDITITAEKKQEWTTYRQSLRDIPQTFSNPDDVTYPDKPE